MTTEEIKFGLSVRERAATNWHVFLPHSCDTWDFAGAEYGDQGATQEEALKALLALEAEVQAAIAAVRGGEDYGPGDTW